MTTQHTVIKTLIADDSEDDCFLFDAMLHQVNSLSLIGFVHDGAEAIEYLSGSAQFKERKTFPYPDLVLLDFRMPRCNGLEVLAYLHRQPHRPRVVLWSNTLEQIDVPLALCLGADLVCNKPAGFRDFVEIIDRLIAETICEVPLVRGVNPAIPVMPHACATSRSPKWI
jgi:CheY-like chemotaxis protein